MSDTPPRSLPLPRSSGADSSPSGADATPEASVSVDAPARTTPLSDEDLEALPDDHRDPIEHLHARVEQAARVIEMLQKENARLRKRVQELEHRPDVPEDHALLTFEDGPEALRGRIERFIEAIDRYLDTEESGDRSRSVVRDETG